MLSLVFYCPDSHVELVKAAIFAAGGGKMGHYDHCCWQILGKGQFRALPGANPTIGAIGALEQIDEWRVELVVAEKHSLAVEKALRDAHPYETPAYHFISLLP